MILHVRGGSFEEEFRCLKYDTNQVIRQLAESGLSEYAPIWSAVTRQLLIGGAVAHGTVLERAMGLAFAEHLDDQPGVHQHPVAHLG